MDQLPSIRPDELFFEDSKIKAASSSHFVVLGNGVFLDLTQKATLIRVKTDDHLSFLCSYSPIKKKQTDLSLLPSDVDVDGNQEAAPLFDRATEQPLTKEVQEAPAEPATKGDPLNSRFKSGGSLKSCWNCGGTDHDLRDCTKPRNNVLISLNRASFRGASGGGGGGRRNVRHTLLLPLFFFSYFILFILLSSERGLEGSYEDEPTVLYRRPRQGVCPTKVFKNHNLL